jgi:hypothetical protein
VKLNAFPLGLLDLVGAQNFGKNADELSQVLVGTVDVRDLILANRVVGITSSAGAITAGANGGAAFATTIPPSELWYIHRLSILAATAAGEAVTMYPIVTFNGNTIALGPSITLGASTNGYVVVPDVPFIGLPGMKLSIWGNTVTGAPSGGLNYLVTKIHI